MLQSPSSGWKRPAALPPGRQLAEVGTPLLQQYVVYSFTSHADISEHAVLEGAVVKLTPVLALSESALLNWNLL